MARNQVAGTGSVIKDPFARKMWKAGLGFASGMLVLFAVLTIVYVHVRPSCPDQLISESVSPDKRWTASILQHRCGEESPFISRVTIRSGTSRLKRGFFSGQALEPPVFTVEQDALGAGLTLLWSGPDQLTVLCAKCSPKFIRMRENLSGPVTILYQIPER